MATQADYTAVANDLVRFFTSEIQALPQFEQGFIPMDKVPAAAGAVAKRAVDTLDAFRATEKPLKETPMNGIDPRIGAWFNLVVVMLGLIGAGTITLTGIPEPVVSLIKAWSLNIVAIIGAANLVFHLYSAPSSAPKGLKRLIAPPQA